MRLDTIAEDSAEMATRIANALPERLHAMRDAMQGQPGGHSFEIRGTASVLWCWEHEREVHACHAAGYPCDGETIITNDPTGEAAVHPDSARNDRRELEQQICRAHRALDRVVDILAVYAYRPALADAERAGIGKCADCTRYADGKERRLTNYKGTGDMICQGCRVRRDRTEVA